VRFPRVPPVWCVATDRRTWENRSEVGSSQPIECEAPVGGIGDLGVSLCCGFAGDGAISEVEAGRRERGRDLAGGDGGISGLWAG